MSAPDTHEPLSQSPGTKWNRNPAQDLPIPCRDDLGTPPAHIGHQNLPGQVTRRAETLERQRRLFLTSENADLDPGLAFCALQKVRSIGCGPRRLSRYGDNVFSAKLLGTVPKSRQGVDGRVHPFIV